MSAINGHRRSVDERQRAYAEKALVEECGRVIDAAPNTSNATLNRAAFSLGQLSGAGLIDRRAVEARLLEAAAIRCDDMTEARRTIKSGLDGGEMHPRETNSGGGKRPSGKTRRSTSNSNNDKALAIWNAAQPIAGTLGESYLASRGLIANAFESLRFSPSVKFQSEGVHPAIISAVTVPATGAFLALQRTALNSSGDGKASIAQAKLSLGPTKGGAVVFGDLNAGEYILEGEGIETVLSACQASGCPGIATLSAVTLGKPLLPPGRTVVILADLGSEAAAKAGAQRRYEEGREVRIALPFAGRGKDFNDTLCQLGQDAVASAVSRAELYQPDPPAPSVVSRRLSEVEPKPVAWLWKPRFALGKLSLIAGQPGRGKSQLSLYMAAMVSRGNQWPDGGTCESGSVILISCEDDLADTIVPRLQALDADLDKIHTLDAVFDEKSGERCFGLRRDVPRLLETTGRFGDVKLVIIDPVTAYLDGIDSHKNADVRSALLPLQKFAEASGAAVLLISHFNKGSPDGGAMSRVSGSGAFVAVCRSAWLVELDPADTTGATRILAPMKNNIGDDKSGFAFTLESTALDKGLEASRVRFLPGVRHVFADELVRPQASVPSTPSAVDEAADFLKEYLVDGPILQTKVLTAAIAAGHKKRTVERAKAELGIRSEKSSQGRSLWRLPENLQDNLFEELDGQQCQARQVRHEIRTSEIGGLAQASKSASMIRGIQTPPCENLGDVGDLGGVGSEASR